MKNLYYQENVDDALEVLDMLKRQVSKVKVAVSNRDKDEAERLWQVLKTQVNNAEWN